jgi:hypothetical protein
VALLHRHAAEVEPCAEAVAALLTILSTGSQSRLQACLSAGAVHAVLAALRRHAVGSSIGALLAGSRGSLLWEGREGSRGEVWLPPGAVAALRTLLREKAAAETRVL